MADFFLKSAYLQRAHKIVTKTLLVTWNCNMSISFGPWERVRFLRRFRFAVISAAFLSHFLSSLVLEHFCCDLAQVKA